MFELTQELIVTINSLVPEIPENLTDTIDNLEPEIKQNLIEIINKLGPKLKDIPNYICKDISDNFFAYKSDVVDLKNKQVKRLEYEKKFNEICINTFKDWKRNCITDRKNVADLHKARDLLFSMTNANISNLGSELEFKKLVKIYAASYDKKLLLSAFNEKTFLLENQKIYFGEHNTYKFSEENIITSSRDAKFGRVVGMTSEDVISYTIDGKIKLGFSVKPKIEDILKTPNTTPQELASYMRCLDYMDVQHTQRLNKLDDYNYINKHLPCLFENKKK